MGFTPEQRQTAEDRINATLALGNTDLVQRRVCVHPDRTTTVIDGGYKIECDYCPAWSTVMFGGTWPDIEPWYYEDTRA